MPDREKVIKGLNSCSGSGTCVNSCPYYDNCGNNYSCTSNLAKDALALLKEQEQDIQNLIADFDDLREEHEKLLDKKIPLITSGKNVIQCKDCKYGKQLFPDYISCQISDENESGCHASHKPEWFCADGDRR